MGAGFKQLMHHQLATLLRRRHQCGDAIICPGITLASAASSIRTMSGWSISEAIIKAVNPPFVGVDPTLVSPGAK